MKERNWSYLAGIFDGEGCAHIAKINSYTNQDGSPQTGYRLDVHITNTSIDLVKWLVERFGGVYYTIDMKNPNWKVAYRWQPKGKKNKELLFLGILPYLVIKKEVIQICLDFLRLEGCCPEKRSELCDKARLLTRRGKSVETNMLGSEQSEKIEPDLISDYESASPVMANA